MSKMFGNNLRYLRNKNGIEQLELAHLLGRKSASSVSEWEKGTYTPKSGLLSDIAKIFNVTLQDLMTTDLSKGDFADAEKYLPAIVPIPILNTVTCLEPILAKENIKGYRHESINTLPSGNLYYLKTTNKSMEPTIPKNSYVLIREQNEVEDGDIAAVLLNGDKEIELKRVKKVDHMKVFVPDNPSYELNVITTKNAAKILGKAVRFTQNL